MHDRGRFSAPTDWGGNGISDPSDGRLWLLTTGGTISTTVDRSTGRSAPTIGPEGLRRLVRQRHPGIDVHAEAIDARPSWALTPEEMLAIALRARELARDPGTRGVVLTHGTTTLEYTAFLADAVLDGDTPVVLTGSMRKADQADADGPGNLGDALAVAASDAARGKGALVVFAGRVIAAGRAWKSRRVDADAFVDTEGDLGTVRNGDVRIARGTGRTGRTGPFAGVLETRVGFVKVMPGMQPALLEAAADGMRGLVLEALPGVGGVPEQLHVALGSVAQTMPVVVAPRSPFGTAPEVPSGGTGEPLAELPLLSPGALTAEQAWLLLMLVLGEEQDAESARRRFRGEVFR
jgi:L-asparaginase